MQLSTRYILLGSILFMIFYNEVPNSQVEAREQPKLGKLKDKKAAAKKAEVDKEKFISFTRPKAAWCNRIDRINRMGRMAHNQIGKAVKSLQLDHNITVEEKRFHISRFKILEKELNETQEQIVDSLNWLNDVLRGDYKDVINMRLSSQKRLEALRDATVREEQEYNAIAQAEEKMKQFNQSKVEGMLAEILHDVADAADKLEADLNDHVFDQALGNPNQAKGVNIEAVIRMDDTNQDTGTDATNTNDTRKAMAADSGGVIKLVDAQDNQFVLAKAKDSTVPHEDHQFIQDVLSLVILSFLLGTVCTSLQFPSMFGYIFSGILLGPSGFNVLKSLVQLETLGEFGVFFILFSVGLEFSPEKIKKVARVAVLGSVGIMVIMILCGIGLGVVLSSPASESAFVAACLSLSSTPLVVKFLSPSSQNHDDEGPGGTEYGMVLLGILIMQDVLLGVLMALLPNMAPHTIDDSLQSASLTYLLLALRILGALVAILLVCWVVARYILGYIYNILLTRFNREILMLASVSLAFVMLMVTDMMKVSMELGCFLAGVLLSAQGPTVCEQVERLVQPIKDLLAVLFFASIGLHVFPTFMVYELTYLLTFTIFIVTAKFVIGVVVIAVLMRRSGRHIKWLVAAGLAQVSEFSFVLGSRARRLGLISREVYLLILSVTTLSLLLAPLLWRISLWQLRIKLHSRSRNSKHAKLLKSPQRSSEDYSSEKSEKGLQALQDIYHGVLFDEGHTCTCAWQNTQCHGHHGGPATRNGSLCNLLTTDDTSNEPGVHGTNLVHRHNCNHFTDINPALHYSHETLYDSHISELTQIRIADNSGRDMRRVSY